MNFSIRKLYLTNRFFVAMAIIVLILIASYSFPSLFIIAKGIIIGFGALVLFELISLFRYQQGVLAHREVSDRFSNGDFNDVILNLDNRYPFGVHLKVIDEIPEQFQKRDAVWERYVPREESAVILYQLRPVKRGEYHFGSINVYVSFLLQLVERKFNFEDDRMIAVYPSIQQMKNYEFAAFTHQLKEYGIKKVRRLGHTFEFDQIKGYVKGDDPRTLNWKASARANNLMVNTYQDEKSQAVYCVIDKGRMMRFPFSGMSLLDYAINTTLVMCNIAIKKQDKAGIITFSNKLSSIVAASKKPGQMTKILETLYNQKTLYKESSFELLSAYINKKITQRSLLLCFSNFESYSSFSRQLPYFVTLSKRHLLVVIFFRNRELVEIINSTPQEPREVYTQVVAQQYETDKILVTRKLKSYGIHSILTDPESLTVDTINKYLEMKSRGTI